MAGVVAKFSQAFPGRSIRRVDGHTHILPKKWPNYNKILPNIAPGTFLTYDYVEDEYVNMYKDEAFFRQVAPNCFDTIRRSEDLKTSKIDLQVVCTVPVMFHYHADPSVTTEIASYLNTDLAATCRSNPNFVGLGTLPMNASVDVIVKELESCITEHGFAGIQIGSHINDMTLGDERLFPVFEACERLSAAVLIHPWDMPGKDLYSKYWLPWLVGMPAELSYAACSLIFGNVLGRLPNLRVCLSHGGGSFPWTIGRISHGHDVRPDLVALDEPRDPREFLSRFYYDAHVCDPYALKELVSLVGADRVMMGSDYPFPLGESPIGSLIESVEPAFDEETKNRLYAGTALEWLGIQK